MRSLGVENVYQPNISSRLRRILYEQAGPSALADFDHQLSGIVQERAHLPGHVVTSSRRPNIAPRVTDFNVHRSLELPGCRSMGPPIPRSHNLTLYGNYGVLLSLGPQAPWWVDNSSEFLAPFNTRQTEIGAKYEHTNSPDGSALSDAPTLLLSQDHLRPRRFLPHRKSWRSVLRVRGPQTHSGIEFSAQGKAANWIQLSASAAALRANSSETGTPAYDNKQVIKFRLPPHFLPMSGAPCPRAARDAWLELHQPQRSDARRHGQRRRATTSSTLAHAIPRRGKWPHHTPSLRRNISTNATGKTRERASVIPSSIRRSNHGRLAAHYTF